MSTTRKSLRLSSLLTIAACSAAPDATNVNTCDIESAATDDVFAEGWTVHDVLSATLTEGTFSVPLAADRTATATLTFDTSELLALVTATDCQSLQTVYTHVGATVRVVRDSDNAPLLQADATVSRIQAWLADDSPVLTSYTHAAAGAPSPA